MAGQLKQHIGRFRWVICTVLLIGVTKNYMDRLVIGVLKNTLMVELGWSETDYGYLVMAFTFSYAIGMVVIGRIVDWLGTRLGYVFAMVTWSLAAMSHGFLSSLSGFIAARSVLGFGEAGVFPASLKAVAEWFPKKERALAVGIFNAGTNVGAIITPPLVAWITYHWGWRMAFISLGGVGLIWLVLWMWIYKEPEDHPRVSKSELDYIKSDPVDPPGRMPWSSLLGYRQTWAFMLGKFITDPIWWFYLFWVPGFLQKEHGLKLMDVGLPLVVIYLIADVGSIAGGWASSSMIRHGRTPNASRKLTMLACAIAVIPIVFAPSVSSTWGAVLLIGLATAAHQGFSSNLLTLPSDMFPAKAVASVVGLGGMAGSLGGVLIARIVSYLLEKTGNYAIPFAIAGSAYLIGLLVIHLLVPKLQMATIKEARS
ncbi:MAG TPA: MFS transporter [Terriglobales bacterium]|nr:MFS transporter [Terriglobales bacterium]